MNPLPKSDIQRNLIDVSIFQLLYLVNSLNYLAMKKMSGTTKIF